MIALNELLENFDSYQNAYREMGLKINLNTFLMLEKKRKEVQLQFEKCRADCNKLCKTVADKRKQNLSTDELINQIKQLDSLTKKLEKKLEKQGRIIDAKLKKLRNIPDTLNKKHLQIKTTKTESSIDELLSFLKNICKSQYNNSTIQEYLNLQENKLFKEDELPNATICNNGVLILTTAREFDEFAEKLLSYLKENSRSLVKLSVYKMKKSSSSEYFVHLKRKTYLKIAFKREFFTRELRIKYRDKTIDMTKFINQININF